MDLHGCVWRPVAHSEDVDSKFYVAWITLVLYILSINMNVHENYFKIDSLACINCKLCINILQRQICLGVCAVSANTCLNWIIMSLDSSMSLNIPSSLLVNAAPHSGGSQNHNKPQAFIHTSTYFHASSALMLDRCQNLDYSAQPKGSSRSKS